MNRSTLLSSVLWQLFFHVASTNAFLGSSPGTSQHVSRNGRYFVRTGILPPLTPVATIARLPKPSNDTMIAQALFSSVEVGNIPVTYTNNPRVVDDWLCENLPIDGGVIGFDIEVSHRKQQTNMQCPWQVFKTKGSCDE
jgi:hypothetical protein